MPVEPRSTRPLLILVLALAFISLQCNGDANTNVAPKNPAENAVVANYGYEVVNSWPHDPDAFTQGLVFLDGKLLESTGQPGHSSLRSVELETGKVLKKVDVPIPYFADDNGTPINAAIRFSGISSRKRSRNGIA